MKLRDIFFNWLAPIFAGFSFGFALRPVYEFYDTLFVVVFWVIITILGLSLYIIRSNYWKVKFEKEKERK